MGVGIWLARERTTNTLVGFCGFLEDAERHLEPQLVYALLGHFAGSGYATEMARASIAQARTCPDIDGIVATVDEINESSRRVLEKVGFARVAPSDGASGKVLLCRLPVTRTGTECSRPQSIPTRPVSLAIGKGCENPTARHPTVPISCR